MGKRLLTTWLAIAIFLSACTEQDASLWGQVPSPTPALASVAVGNTPLPADALIPTITSTPTITPLAVLPLPGTSTPGGPNLAPTPTLPPVNTAGPMLIYRTQSGDTLNLVAKRFGVSQPEIISDTILPPAGELLNPGQILLIPNMLVADMTSDERILPDSDVVFSVTAADFDVQNFVLTNNGYLNQYREYLQSNGWTNGAGEVIRIATDNSINPRVLLALIELESGWVSGQPSNIAQEEYPLGYVDFQYRGLYRQMSWAVQSLSHGYYGWRAGTLSHLTFKDGSSLRLNPSLNAGSVAVLYTLALTRNRDDWIIAVGQFTNLFNAMFGDPWERDANLALLPGGLTQPPLILPFERGKTWSFTGGPHGAWERDSVPVALDFSPPADVRGCNISSEWVVAPAAGKVVRVGNGVVVLDLDMDGIEQTGWNILFLHISAEERVTLGAELKLGDRIGHPSCEGGVSTGTHVHIARKYNGEWILAEGPLGFNLEGWMALNGDEPYLGYLVRGEKVLEACTCGSSKTHIRRDMEP